MPGSGLASTGGMTRRSRSSFLHVRAALAAVILLCSAASIQAATVTLTWDPSPETDVAGYIVFYGTSSGQYAANVDVGNITSYQFNEPDPQTRYYFAVAAYNAAGVRSDLSAEVHTDPLVLTELSPSMPAPQSVGTNITFTAATAGSVVPQFKWLIFDGAAWRTYQDWSASSNFTWTPTAANANYRVGVWARSASSTADAPDPAASGYVSFPVVAPLELTNLSANVQPPQTAGTNVIFTASATGGIAPYQYKWLISDGKTWSVAQAWSANHTFTWTPSVANANYSVGVWVRSATSTNDAPDNSSAGSTLKFAITANVQITVTSLTANKSAPQIAGSKVLFTAAASGAKSPQFKWWVFDGAVWAIAQEWSNSDKFNWSPPVANPNYQVLVRVRDETTPSAESSGAAMPFPIVAPTENGRSADSGRGRK